MTYKAVTRLVHFLCRTAFVFITTELQIRFFRMLKLVNSFLRDMMGPTSTLVLRLFRLIAFMMFAAHAAACLWYYIGFVNYNDEIKGSWLRENDVDTDNVVEAYIVSMYWSIVTLYVLSLPLF